MAPLPTALLVDVLVRVASITVFIALGVGLASVAVEFGAVEYIAGFARPLTQPANLPPEVGTAILATTASPTAGYGMLAEYREAGLLDDRATLVAVTMNTFFGFAQHIFTFYAPVLIPILGLKVGLMYVGARALISLAITATGVLAGALLLSERNVDTTVEADVDEPAAGAEADGGEPRDRRARLRAAAASTVEKIRDIVPRLLVVYLIVATLVAYYDEIVTVLFGSPDALGVASAVAPVTGALGLPSAAIPTIAVFAVDTTNGAIFIAPLVENGTFTARAAVATMLVGGIVSFAVSTFKRSIPFQYGIWGREFGSKVIVVNTVLKVLFIAVALVVLLAPSAV
ncbi:nucleoside recognition protein [Halorientalis sp. IM1011]|uniref:nucleoside recognition domain-containing protein n=1 Tax=Halorientalis sp. IM1011 TaxID=1932360 RepID=UPI00097CC4CB|nr:nucleoside recognition domain-containing protein [Halorientalis sp. IM1011]AQL42634.1 nucleoside recognition protein [Halorientalis sp. IM1011]